MLPERHSSSLPVSIVLHNGYAMRHRRHLHGGHHPRGLRDNVLPRETRVRPAGEAAEIRSPAISNHDLDSRRTAVRTPRHSQFAQGQAGKGGSIQGDMTIFATHVLVPTADMVLIDARATTPAPQETFIATTVVAGVTLAAASFRSPSGGASAIDPNSPTTGSV
ncbi:amine sulfotransferase [Ixodes scapularis]